MKFKFDKNMLLSAGIIVLSGAVTLLKNKDEHNKKEAEKEQWINEALERLSKKEEN